MKTRRLFLREMTGEYLEAQTTICPNMSKLTFFVSLCACSLSAHRRARSLPVTCLIVWHLARIEQSLARRRREWAHAWWLGAWIRWKNVRVCLSRTGWQQESSKIRIRCLSVSRTNPRVHIGSTMACLLVWFGSHDRVHTTTARRRVQHMPALSDLAPYPWSPVIVSSRHTVLSFGA